MSVAIIVKNSERQFRRHFNREMTDRAHPNGQMIYTREDYVKGMKARGLEHYDKNSVKQRESKKYVPSKEARYIASYVDSHKDKRGRVNLPTKLRDWIADSSGHKNSKILKNIRCDMGGSYASD